MTCCDQNWIYEIVSLDGRPLCWACGKRPPRLDGRWCSTGCKHWGEEMIEQSPTPTEIVQATRIIQATWSEQETARRLNGLTAPEPQSS